jgi:hypothetical protein
MAGYPLKYLAGGVKKTALAIRNIGRFNNTPAAASRSEVIMKGHPKII